MIRNRSSRGHERRRSQTRRPTVTAPGVTASLWHCGMKVHVGTDRRGIVHTLTTTAANASDIGQRANLLHGAEREVYGDQAYWCEAHRQAALSRRIRYRVNRRGNHGHKLTRYERAINRIRSATRARAEHVFHAVKKLSDFTKVRYRGLAKNAARLLPPSPWRTCTW